MKIEFREAKSVITKSNIPGIDYVINPYTGCNDPFLPYVLLYINGIIETYRFRVRFSRGVHP